MSSSNDPRAQRSRRALLDTAIELFLENPHTSLLDVAKHAQVGRATLYRHFGTREELIEALAAESMRVTDEILKPLDDPHRPAIEVLEAGIRALMPIADRFHFILAIWSLASPGEPAYELYQSQLDRLAELIERAKREGAINANLSTDWVVMLVDSISQIGWWSIRNGDLDAGQAADQAVISLLDGIGSCRK